MKNILIPLFTKKIIPNIGMIAVTIFTTTTTGVAAYKLSQAIPTDRQIIEPVAAVESEKNDNSEVKGKNPTSSETNSNEDAKTISENSDYYSEDGINNYSDDNSNSSTANLPSNNTNTVVKNTTSETATFTLQTLALHNKSQDCYIAYSGTVYDVSDNPQWINCIHHGITGGQDITSKFPHPTTYLNTLPIVGSLINTDITPPSVDDDTDDDDNEQYEDSEEDESSEENVNEDESEDELETEEQENEMEDEEEISQISIFRELASNNLYHIQG